MNSSGKSRKTATLRRWLSRARRRYFSSICRLNSRLRRRISSTLRSISNTTVPSAAATTLADQFAVAHRRDRLVVAEVHAAGVDRDVALLALLLALVLLPRQQHAYHAV